MAHRPDPDFEPPHDSSPTAHIVDQIELYGFTPSDDEPDPREPADDTRIGRVMEDAFDAIADAIGGTRSEPDGSDLLWGLVNACHRAAERVGRLLDDNEVAQRDSQREQDGSEVKSVELERLLAKGSVLLDRRDALEAFRDSAADSYRRITGEAWTPRHGSRVNHRALTAAMIDSRDFIAAKRRAETQVLMPAGARIAFTGGTDYNDHRAIWAALDRVRAKHADMVLLHGAGPKGAELIAAKWADARGVTQIAFKPDWDRHKRAAPFKRNDAMLDTLPIGVVVFPGTGITDNLTDKAKKLGIPLFDFRKASA
ncbi:MAG: DUF2493 domain-containing protein [Sphingomonadaceae bacterium]|nr:DUF2493 domain-containing protein [Sphingomonadaceae bacterium]